MRMSSLKAAWDWLMGREAPEPASKPVRFPLVSDTLPPHAVEQMGLPGPLPVSDSRPISAPIPAPVLSPPSPPARAPVEKRPIHRQLREVKRRTLPPDPPPPVGGPSDAPTRVRGHFLTKAQRKQLMLDFLVHHCGASELSRRYGIARQNVYRHLKGPVFEAVKADLQGHASERAKHILRTRVDDMAEQLTRTESDETMLEVMDRLEVLPKIRKEPEGGQSFQIIVGMPGNGQQLPPPPAPKQIGEGSTDDAA